MGLALKIALRAIVQRKRQSLVSILGIVLGVSFFLAISGLMRGSERDFIQRLVDNAPHVTIRDEYRKPQLQPLAQRYPSGALEFRGLKPRSENRGIRQFQKFLSSLKGDLSLRIAPVLVGQALIKFAGRDFGVTLNGMTPADIKGVTTLEQHLVSGCLQDLWSANNGLLIGEELARNMAVDRGDLLLLASTAGVRKIFKVVAIFRTGRSQYDLGQVYANLKPVQALLDLPNRINRILIKLTDPYAARVVAHQLELAVGYKSVSWQEESEDLLNALTVRNIIMYTVVSAVLLVAAFGIYNVISTVVLEKQRDIAILKSMGFESRDIQYVFLFQGVLVGAIGSLIGVPLGAGLMYCLQLIEFKPPGVSSTIALPMDWGWAHFAVGVCFAMGAAVLASYVPARKAGFVRPIDILRGIR